MITVSVVAPFPLEGLDRQGNLNLPSGVCVLDLLRQAKAPIYTYILPVSINGHLAGKRTRLKDGDMVVFIAPISGG